MTKIERIAVVMTTYFPAGEAGARRAQYARRALDTLAYGLHTLVPLMLVVADDGSDEALFDGSLKGAILNPPWYAAIVVAGPNRGVGTSLNRALDRLEADWGTGDDWAWIYTTDDWALTAPVGLDLTLPVWLAENGYDIVRLGLAHPDLHCTTRFRQDVGWWLDLDLPKGGYGFATRPALFAPALRRVAGRFDEGLNSYETERLYAERVAKTPGILAAVAVESMNTTWEHLAEGDVSIGAREPEHA